MKIEYQQYDDTWKVMLISKEIVTIGLGKSKEEALDNITSNIAAKSDKVAAAWGEATQTAAQHLAELEVLHKAYDFLMNQGYEND